MRLATLALLLHVPLPRCMAAAPPLQGRPSVSFEQYVHREYRTQDGLPSNWIQALLQTRDGHVWVGTHNGLARFDGLRFDV